jgi:type IV secretion system protein VirB1
MTAWEPGRPALPVLIMVVVYVGGGAAEPALAASLSLTEFTALAARCAPTIPVETLEAVARTESGLDPWALHDNTTGREEKPGGLDLAVAETVQWAGRGDSVDIGLMQINSANLPALGMTASTALDPCVSLAGGAAVLRAAYGGGTTSAEKQAALLMALSRYNTGSPFRGIMNGYARTVMENAGDDSFPALSSSATVPRSADPNAPPSWDVSATGTYTLTHGAPWLISLSPALNSQNARAGPKPPPEAIASK